MIRLLRGRIAAAALGAMACFVVYVAFTLLLPDVRQNLEERATDLTLGLAMELVATPAPGSTPVVVIDIDAASTGAIGAWPWRRSLLADLVDKAAAAGAVAIAIDILFADPDQRSPAALARRLGQMVEDPSLAALADRLDDDDRRFAQALGGRPTVLGFALTPTAAKTVRGAPVLVRGRAGLDGMWRFAGADAPTEVLAAAATGSGCLALPGDSDGIVRRLPLFVGVGDEIRPGLALEAVRVGVGASLYKLDGGQGRFATGSITGALAADAMLRLPPLAATPPIKAIPARDVLAANGPVAALAGAIVFIGGSAPELGGLRATAGASLTPSVMIHAAAARQILQGFVPRTSALLQRYAYIVAGLAGLVGVAIPLLLPPLAGAGVMLAAIAAFAVFVVNAAAGGVLIEPALALVLAATGYVVTAILAFAFQHRRERHIRRRFEQHLSPHVVAMIARDPSLLKLKGQRREVTAMFTDIANFTGLTHGTDPETLVAMLDAYFGGMSEIVVAHGGMVDKFVGDAIHALFNAPLEQPGHAQAAVRCALALHAWSEAFRRREVPAALGFGHTRIGVETGEVIVGDVGTGSKLDYTAYGDTVNAAARLEAANKELGTMICVGPGTAARCPAGLLRPGKTIQLRGFDVPIQVFEPVTQGTGGSQVP
ncbi:adenylate/guanylate cyclase domain-containing protein [Oleomonas cavernae]|nr:adenylate/guanylate cyclase domain-containing protein [Oleomonas cavernae]